MSVLVSPVSPGVHSGSLDVTVLLLSTSSSAGILITSVGSTTGAEAIAAESCSHNAAFTLLYKKVLFYNTADKFTEAY
jgi:hypothetical protein